MSRSRLTPDHHEVVNDTAHERLGPVTFMIAKTASGQWFFKIVASNNRTLAHSENYWNLADAVHAAQLIIGEASAGTIKS